MCICILVAPEYSFDGHSHLHYQLASALPARRTWIQVLVRTRKHSSIIVSLVSRDQSEYLRLEVSWPCRHTGTTSWSHRNHWCIATCLEFVMSSFKSFLLVYSSFSPDVTKFSVDFFIPVMVLIESLLNGSVHFRVTNPSAVIWLCNMESSVLWT